jgi:sRNA-binding carbon storage regulator CsrA
MLKLQRTAGQQVVLYADQPGRQITMTVKSVRRDRVTLHFDLPGGLERGLELIAGRPMTLNFTAHPVEISLRAIERGGARLGFEAPFDVRIERSERLAEKQGSP